MTVVFGELITEKRKEKNMTQEELAEQLFVTRQTVSRWERGHAYPNIDTLVELSLLLEFSIDYALTGDEQMIEEVSEEQRKNTNRKWLVRTLVVMFIMLVFVVTIFIFHGNIRLASASEIDDFFYSHDEQVLSIKLTDRLFWKNAGALAEVDDGIVTVDLYRKLTPLALFDNSEEQIQINLEDFPNFSEIRLKGSNQVLRVN